MDSINKTLKDLNIPDNYIKRMKQKYLDKFDLYSNQKDDFNLVFRIVNDIDRPDDDISPTTSFSCHKCGASISHTFEWTIEDCAFHHASALEPLEVACTNCGSVSHICYIYDNYERKDRFNYKAKNPDYKPGDDFKY